MGMKSLFKPAYKTLASLVKQKGAGELLPKWFIEDFVGTRNALISHTFALHGDTGGLWPNPYVLDELKNPYVDLFGFLSKISSESEMVIFYDIARGAEFLKKEMKDKFMELSGLKEEAGAKSTGNPIEDAKAKLAAKKGIPREPELCLPLIEKVLKKQEKTIIIIKSANFVFPAGGPGGALPANERVNIERLRNWSLDEEIRAKRSVIILIAGQMADISSELRKPGTSVTPIFLPRPDSDERQVFIETSLDLDPKLKLSTGVKEFTIATQGLNLAQIKNIFLRASSDGKEVDLSYVKSEKNKILNEEYGDILEVVEAEHAFEGIGGMEYIKTEMQEIVSAIKVGDTKRIPAGITLMGPPGTGKTALVEAFAKSASYNFVKIKNLRSKWVGESESKSEKLRGALLSLAPVVVMNDESDLGGMNRDDPKGDSGVSERLMRDWMTLLSDPKVVGKILVINCTNRIDRMDAALKRSGRSDERWLLPMPALDERTKIFEVMFKELEKIPTTLTDFKPFAEAVGDISGADIRSIVKSSYKMATRAGATEVSADHVKQAISDFIPNASQKDIDLMHLLGIMESSSRRMLPPNALELVLSAARRRLVPGISQILDRIIENRILPTLEAELAKLAEGK